MAGKASPIDDGLSPAPNYEVAEGTHFPRTAIHDIWQTHVNSTIKDTCAEPPPYHQQQNFANQSGAEAAVVPSLTSSPPPPTNQLPLDPLQAEYLTVTSTSGPPAEYINFLPTSDQILLGQHQVVKLKIGSSHLPAEVKLDAVESFASQLALSCFVLWFCNVVFGLVAFILAAMASSKSVSHARRAHQLGRASQIVTAVGVAFSVVFVVLLVSVWVSSQYSDTGRCLRYEYNSMLQLVLC